MNVLNKKSVEDIDVRGKKVLIRCDFNVKMEDGVITSDKRIVEALPTIKYLLDQGAMVILCSHMGKPHNIFTEGFGLNKKEKAAAIKSALSSRVAEEKIYVVDSLTFDEIKTKKMAAVLDSLKVEKALVVLDKKDENVILSARNLPEVRTVMSNGINVYDILKYGSLVITKEAVAQIEEVYA